MLLGCCVFELPMWIASTQKNLNRHLKSLQQMPGNDPQPSKFCLFGDPHHPPRVLIKPSLKPDLKKNKKTWGFICVVVHRPGGTVLPRCDLWWAFFASRG
jgi:hypothetical protein